jgi:signal peptidase I
MERINTLLIFALGFLSCMLLVFGFFTSEKPFGIVFSGNISAPSDIVKDDKIKVYPDRVVIYLENPSLSSYAPTGSMIPVFDSGANGIRIKPKSEKEINLGDIISFKSSQGLIVHRVIEKGEDELGVYFVTKGDNSPVSDGKIRFSDIEYLTIGVIY